MPFITDASWTPARYRRALSAWSINAPTRDSEVGPRKVRKTEKPRHDDLARKLRALLVWRSLFAGSDWTVVAANDNRDEREPELIDSEFNIRPRLGEIFRALVDVEFTERRHARLGGGGEIDVVATGGDIERGEVWPGSVRRRLKAPPPTIVRLGRLEFSNGGKEEPALVLVAGKPAPGAVRIELGGLTRFAVGTRGKARDGFGKPKGANDNTPPATVGGSQAASRGAMNFRDPVADAQEAERVRRAVAPGTARLLDLALRAANFREIGEQLGHSGKHAERKGKAALIEACGELDGVLAA